MQQLRDRHGYETVERALRYLSIRLRSRPQTSELAPEIDAERARLRQVEDTWSEARELRIAATAEIEYLDGELDRLLGDLSRAALVEVRGRTDDERYRRLFPQPLRSGAAPMGGPEQERYVRTILAQLTSESGPLPALRDRAEAIEQALTALQQAEQRRAELYVPEATATAERNAALDRARRAYNQTYPRLRLLFPDRPALVASYFVSLRSRSVRPASGDDPVEPTS